MTMTRLAPLLLLAACATAPGAPVAPAAVAETGVFTMRQEANTILMERFTRTPAHLEAELTLTQGPRLAYAADLRPDASVARIEVRQYAPGADAGADPGVRSSATFAGDSVMLTQTRDGTTQEARRGTVAGVVPYVNPSPSLMEQVVRRARAMGGTHVEVPVWIPGGGGQNATATVHLAGSETRISMGGVEVVLEVDGAGRILGGSVPSQGLTIERAPAP